LHRFLWLDDSSFLVMSSSIGDEKISSGNFFLKPYLHTQQDSLTLQSNHIGTAQIRHQCRKTAVLSCHSCLINTGVEKMNNI
jgi:hypothetical protein